MEARESLLDSYKERSDSVKIAVLTSNYHVFRAKSIARKQGIYNISGIAAPGDPVLAIHMWVRECFAVLKDKFMGKMYESEENGCWSHHLAFWQGCEQ